MSIRKRTWSTAKGEQVAWVVDYKDGDGKRRLKTFKKKKDAEAWAPQAAVEVRRGVHTPDSASITVNEAAENWLKTAEKVGRERSTIAQYEQHVKYHIAPRIGTMKLSRLSTPGVEAFKDDLLGSVSRPMAKKVLASVKALLSDAQRRGSVAQNVALGVKVETPKRHQRKLTVGVDIPSPDEIKAIIGALEGRWRPLLVTAILTGLRASELRGLTWDDVDFEGRAIHVRRRADRYNQFGSPKSHAGERDVPMSPELVKILKEWRLACPIGELKLVFPNGAGKVESLANIWNRGLRPAQVRAGIVDDDGKPRYGMHALRHFYASWCINRKRDGGLELPPKRVQERLGHSSITMTLDRYGHLFAAGDDDYSDMADAERTLLG
jgi:integrase